MDEDDVEDVETEAVALRMIAATSICKPVACRFCSASKIAAWNFPVVSRESAYLNNINVVRSPRIPSLSFSFPFMS